jgi:hypothetical protein
MGSIMLTAINNALPLLAPLPCPICGASVYITGVDEWESDSGRIVHFEHECETEPDIDSDEWWGWHNGHWNMPYVDWLPWEMRVYRWLDAHYFYSRID